MAASPVPGTTPPPHLPPPVPALAAGGHLLPADGAPEPPPSLLDAAVARLPRGGWHTLPGPGGRWLLAVLDDPVPALALAPVPGTWRECRRWVRAWAPVLAGRLRERLAEDPWLLPRSASPSLGPLLAPLARAAGTALPVLLGGESGTGKEVVARALHAASGRPGPLVAENCAALPGDLLEAELFGVRRGAYTGAHRDRPGRFRAADGGTLLLDEIGELPLSLQAKLLRVLEEGRVRPLGDDRSRAVNVRVVAATRADLRKMVREGAFREDLYWRLAGLEVTLPPLRARRGDLPWLATALLRRVAGEGLGPGRRLSADALVELERHPFPGNVRELLQVLRRAAILAPGPLVRSRTVREALGEPGFPFREDEDDPLDRERNRIRRALAEAGGNKARAARLLGWSRARFYRRLAAVGLSAPGAPSRPDASRASSTSRSSSRG